MLDHVTRILVSDTVLAGLLDGTVKWIIRMEPMVCALCSGSGSRGGHTMQANDLETECDGCRVWTDVTPEFRDPAKKRIMNWVGTGGASVYVGCAADPVPVVQARGEFRLDLPIPICSMTQASADKFPYERFVLAGRQGHHSVAVGLPDAEHELTMPPETLGGQSVQVGSWAHRVRQ